MKQKSRNVIIAVVLVGIIGFVSYSLFLISQPQETEIQGFVEATHIKVGSKLIGRIDSLDIHRGQEVKAGDFLFRIHSPEVEAKLLQANAARSAAAAQSTKAHNGARNEDIQAAYNVMIKAQAAAEYATKSFERINNLYKEGVIAEQKKDEVEVKMKAAVENAKAAESVYNKAKKGARYEDKMAADALVKRAEGAITEVNSYIQEQMIYAPIDGEIANIISERGELVPSGYPVVSIVDLDDVWVSFHLREDLLADIKKGSRFTAKFPALKMQEVELQVTYITAMGSFANWSATKTSGDFDMKTFEVHAVPTKKVEGLRPGMSALVNWDNVRAKN